MGCKQCVESVAAAKKSKHRYAELRVGRATASAKNCGFWLP
ncbi:hypothetical protein D049_2947A, partial [Vibrio parahaemolyticus VPTS-2010]